MDIFTSAELKPIRSKTLFAVPVPMLLTETLIEKSVSRTGLLGVTVAPETTRSGVPPETGGTAVGSGAPGAVTTGTALHTPPKRTTNPATHEIAPLKFT